MFNIYIQYVINKALEDIQEGVKVVEGRTMKITVSGQNLERVKQFCFLGILVTEDCRSCHEVRRLIALGKEAFNKKSDLMRGSPSLHSKNVW